MSLRLKIVLALTLLAAGATAAIGIVSYTSTKHELEETVDKSLDEAARNLQERPSLGDPDGDDDDPPGRPGHDRPRSFEQVLYQVIDVNGVVQRSGQYDELPVGDADLAVAASTDPNASARFDVTIDGESYRMLTVKAENGAVQLARSLAESQKSVERILRSTLVAVVVVALLSALLGWLIARQVTRRLLRLTTAAGVVADTGRLDVDVPVDGGDETGQLGRAFSGMLAALQASKHEQHQLVQDASHELRTPLTSLRTNVAVLRRRHDQLSAESRDQLLADLDSETRELTDLVNELVELATDRRDDESMQPVRLADVAERAAARARRRFGREVVVQADESVVDGRPNGLERATQNLVDNACKFAPAGLIEVSVVAGTVRVRDHGPGLVADDIPHLFDRFYRSVAMRSMPGSGLGLSIVKSVVDAHGGSVFAANAPDGGAELGFTIPTV
ncbi:MAG: HAMP domain-containing histidine kinase [Ilumatobacteraceae bacterium]|nr:HAMP domain-containing histidine kinase [Acidimicrobiaceae bacterium]MBP6486547.1 HAMP domain-containing histidine kinase [Ilumatobacteraceae bacterium]MBK9971765.1 HAMP domain-containing histidine kinase [Acidimicrobiaceae bacterium]MBP7888346.1 HAMP domain-containing histidine kinase [Ilumatobacteraceae bacterium]MBP8208704.1 HAMP domain-containing histidine kinase [Ilumatobacteraceae bacterium]